MENKGVKCSVNGCAYHCGCDKCSLDKIEVTDERMSSDSMTNPHFCKSYKKKN